MAYRKSAHIYNREIDKTGLTTYDDVYGILQDNIDQISEFYEIEPAVVTEVFLNPEDLPLLTTESNNKIPNYFYYGTIKARFIYSQDKQDEITDYIKPLSSHMVVYPVVGEVVNVAFTLALTHSLSGKIVALVSKSIRGTHPHSRSI